MVDSEVVPATGRGERGLLRFFLPVVALWVAPVLIAAIAIPFSIWRENIATSDAAPYAIEAGSIVDDRTAPVSVELRSPSTTNITARSGGIVTAVSLQPGSNIEAGQTLLSVDDVLVRAQVAASPIVGDVDPYSRGADVQRVGSLLAQVGLFDTNAVSGTYTWALRQAIDEWNAQANLPQDGTFRVISTLFVSEGQTSVSAVLVRVGDNLGEGAAAAELARHVSGVRFVPAADGTLAGLNAGPLVFAVADRKFDLAGLALLADQLTDFTAFLEAATTDGLMQTSASKDLEILLGGTLSLAEPRRSATVPNSAVFISEVGNICIFGVAAGAPKPEPTPVPVPEAVPMSGAAGLTSIDSMHAGERFVADVRGVPSEVREQC